jgi:hypothetical protein
MEPEGSLPRSQQPVTRRYPETAKRSPHAHIPVSLRLVSILISHLRLGLPNGIFPLPLPIKILYAFLFVPVSSSLIS